MTGRLRTAIIAAALGAQTFGCLAQQTFDGRNIQFNGVEFAPSTDGSGSCTRAWLQQQTLRLQDFGRPNQQGFVSVLRQSYVVGSVPSDGCRFASPASTTYATHSQIWTIHFRQRPSPSFNAILVPGSISSNFQLPASAQIQSNVKAATDGYSVRNGEGRDVLFLPQRSIDPQASVELNRIVERLNQGSCLPVYGEITQIPAARPRLIEQCDIRRRMQTMLGGYLSLRIEWVLSMPVDTVHPDALRVLSPEDASEPHNIQGGAYFTFQGIFENGVLPGSALLIKKKGQWQTIFLHH